MADRGLRLNDTSTYYGAFLLNPDGNNVEVVCDTCVTAGSGKSCSVPLAIGRSRAGLSTKIHALADALGNPVAFHPRAARPTTSWQPTTCCRICKPCSSPT